MEKPKSASPKLLTRRPEWAWSIIGPTTTGLHPVFSTRYQRRMRANSSSRANIQDFRGQELDKGLPTQESPE